MYAMKMILKIIELVRFDLMFFTNLFLLIITHGV